MLLLSRNVLYQQLSTVALIGHLSGTVCLLQTVEQIKIIFVHIPSIFIAYYLLFVPTNAHIFIDVYLCLLIFYYSYAHITCAFVCTNNK